MTGAILYSAKMVAAVVKHVSPLDVLLPPSGRSIAISPITALRATSQAARDALEVERSPVRALAELALGEILLESGRMPTSTAGDQAQICFEIHNQILTAAAFFRMAIAEQEIGIGTYRKKALCAIDHLLENTVLSSHPERFAAKEFAGSCRTLGTAILETQIKVRDTQALTWPERNSIDATLQKYATRLAMVDPIERSIRGTTLLRSLLWPSSEPERMYSDALARITALPYKVLNIGPLLRTHFLTTSREWLPGAAPLVVAAAFSERLTGQDRIVATMVKIPRPDNMGDLGDIDLLLSIGKKSRSGLSQGLHAIEVKYETAKKNLLDQNFLALKRAQRQIITSQIALTDQKLPVKTAIALFDSIRQNTPIEKLSRMGSDTDRYRVHQPNASGRLALSPGLLDLVFEPETPLDQVLQSIKNS